MRATKYLIGLLLAVLLLGMGVASAEKKVLVVPRAEDLLMTVDAVDADTQVLILAEPLAAGKKQAIAFLQEQNAPEPQYGLAKRLKKYTADKLKVWNKGNAIMRNLVAQLRLDAPDQVLFYCDPAQADLHTVALNLVLQAMEKLPDPTFRGSDGIEQRGVTVSQMTDLSTGTIHTVNEVDWKSTIAARWGELSRPEIPGMPTLNAQGFSDDEVFTYVDEKQGVWFYVSPSLKITITTHHKTSGSPLIWYEAEVFRAPDAEEHLHCYSPVYGKSGHKADKLAEGWVLAINTDYHQKRKDTKAGLIIRDGDLKYTDLKQNPRIKGLPNLDNLLLTRDGGMEVFYATELTPEAALEAGACDVLAFGPVLVKDSNWRQVVNTYHAAKEPRSVVAKFEENHYLLLFATGRRDDSKGISLDELQQLMLLRGVTDAINLDGGATACLFFMGEQIGFSGAYSNHKAVSHRSQYEMLTIGTYAK